MGRALLFMGEKKVGKSTAVRRVVEALGVDHFTGFFAAEQRSEGTRTGFTIVMVDGQEGRLASVDSASSLRVGRLNASGRPKYGVELDFLDRVAIPALRDGLSAVPEKILVIDEIGPMQLCSDAFKAAVLDALEAAASSSGPSSCVACPGLTSSRPGRMSRPSSSPDRTGRASQR